MARSQLVGFLFLVLTSLGRVAVSSSDGFYGDDIKMWGDGSMYEDWRGDAAYDEQQDDWEDEVVEFDAEFGMHRSEGLGRTPVNVDSLGAVGDGVTDDTQAFLDAWNKSCSTPNAVFLVPEQRRYLVKAARFRGPCQKNLIIQIAGTIVAPEEPDSWDPKNPRTWLYFTGLQGAWFQGGGTIDGSGSKWWASSCKINKTNPCRGAPTALTIDSSSMVRVKDLNIQNSQQIHFTVARSSRVRVYNVSVTAPGDSPNTDGVHISDTTNVILQDCSIGTGDDCVSIVNASSNIRMKNIDCGPGHGISIGSLGKDNTTAVVTGIVLDNATLTGTTNGLRIKTWQGGSGYVRAVRYENVRMVDVANPIIIDQFYCDSPKSCKNQTSAVKISQVIYKNISGTSKTPRAMKFACSDTVPCSNIVLNNIDLHRENGTAETYCNCAIGFDFGNVKPAADCLRSDASRCAATQAQAADDSTKESYYPAHTEL